MGPPQSDRHDWKHYLPTTSLAGGRNTSELNFLSFSFPLSWTRRLTTRTPERPAGCSPWRTGWCSRQRLAFCADWRSPSVPTTGRGTERVAPPTEIYKQSKTIDSCHRTQVATLHLITGMKEIYGHSHFTNPRCVSHTSISRLWHPFLDGHLSFQFIWSEMDGALKREIVVMNHWHIQQPMSTYRLVLVFILQGHSAHSL